MIIFGPPAGGRLGPSKAEHRKRPQQLDTALCLSLQPCWFGVGVSCMQRCTYSRMGGDTQATYLGIPYPSLQQYLESGKSSTTTKLESLVVVCKVPSLLSHLIP